MRIQETDRVLKEARYARHAVSSQQQEEGFLSRTWHAITGKLASLFRKR